jgi:Na+/H+ antiporter NhaD/arsenite permease-like protein
MLSPVRDALLDNGLLALIIFAAVYIVMVLDLADRTVMVLFGALTMVGLGVLTEGEAIAAIRWEAIGLIFGMFILVAALTESGFFRWIGLHALKKTKFDLLKIYIVFCALSAFLAAFMDCITVMVFMASLTIEVCVILKAPPLPIIFAEIFSANIGGCATMVGDPPNVIVGTELNMTFIDFATHTAPIAMIAFAVNLVFFGLWYKKIFEKKNVDIGKIIEEHKDLNPFSAVTDVKQMRMALMVFAFTVTLLVMHSVLDLMVAYVAILGAALVILLGHRKMDHLIEKIDWHTIVFLAGLFVMVGGLEKSGLLSEFANGIVGVSGDSPIIIMSVLLWTVGLLAAVFDNIPLAAAMVPVIRSISAQTGVEVNSLAYTMTLGWDIGGNATPIGASTNIVALAIAEKNHLEYSWRDYCKVGIPAVIVTLLVVNLLVVLLLL